MVSRNPMICDSCLHKAPNLFACTAYPTGITLDPMAAELHDEPRPDQDNEIVYSPDPGQDQARQDFLAFREALLQITAEP